MIIQYFLMLAFCNVSVVTSFAGLPEIAAPHSAPSIDALHHASLELSSSNIQNFNPLDLYLNILKINPLTTKMVTGGVLATCGDAIAQFSKDDEEYDRRRAASFGLFDMAYRALQHETFPSIVRNCHGQYMNLIFSTIGLQSIVADKMEYMGAMEQTLVSQLGIVPFIYYPVFFSLTGCLQGLTVDQTILRAKENFIPLMKRNLLFWIPVQFIQFGFISTDLQIPFLSICGLCWTFILSVSAGSIKEYSKEEEKLVVIQPEREIAHIANIASEIVLQESIEKAQYQNTTVTI